jgi:hypothetical protein
MMHALNEAHLATSASIMFLLLRAQPHCAVRSSSSHAHDRSVNLIFFNRWRSHISSASELEMQAAPLQPGALVIDWSSHYSPGKRIPVFANRHRPVERRVRQEREEGVTCRNGYLRARTRTSARRRISDFLDTG